MKPHPHTQNTESDLSPAVKPFVSNTLKETGPTPSREAAAPFSFTLPNPYVQEQCKRRAQLWNPRNQSSSGKCSLQTSERKSITRDSQWSDTSTKHGYSNARQYRGEMEALSDPAMESSSHEKHRKVFSQYASASRPSTDPVSQCKTLTREPLEVTKNEGSRASRSAVKSAERTIAWQGDVDAFEVKLSDFPELSLLASCKSTFPVPQEPLNPHPAHCQASPPHSKNELSLKGQTGSFQSGPAGETEDIPSVSTQGLPLEPVLPSSGLPAASWASIASQHPRQTIPGKTSTASPTTSSQNEVNGELGMEQVSEKKRKKKKKKKSKQLNDYAEVETCAAPVIGQEPPKFQDEEEFPELALSSVSFAKRMSPAAALFSYSHMAKTHTELQNKKDSMSPGDLTSLPLENQKSRTPVGKPPLPETKNGQKAEKTSGKKSKVPVQLDLGNMFAVLEQKQQSQKSNRDPKPIILSVGGAIPVVHKDSSSQKKNSRNLDKVAHNPLDSTCPLVKKGKQREVPKPKKPTPLKKIILKEREERKQTRLLEEMGLVPPTSRPSSDPSYTDKRTTVIPQTQDNAEPEPDESGQVESDTEDTTEEMTPLKTCSSSCPKIHSRKFRDYCSQMLSKDVDECVTTLLKELVRFQDRLYQKDPMKARMKRRLVMGLREVLKHLKLRKVKCVIISPNCERIQSKGGLDEALHTIIEICHEQSVPFVFALSRKALGRCVNKAVPVSLVGIFNYDGAQDHYHKMIELSSQARKAYEMMIANVEKSLQDQQENHADEQNSHSTVDSTESEEPEYIKIWKEMLEKECNHQFLNFEEQLATDTMSNDMRPQVDEDERI
ncbi:selenocysteine insertion sequence-binding protein 2-like isoform X2 [Megalops cyprinoides]|uniref:selenocysteine insertion sequence-binding protein 2-like isoform X2 n=1 Tax=Megalops cyprinoides TaxID=118141 RepID=UPI0018646E77|nr:selenocysteine insertion sequence-binding protein 2-like isoform X2 [Megalops cyprinoides]